MNRKALLFITLALSITLIGVLQWPTYFGKPKTIQNATKKLENILQYISEEYVDEVDIEELSESAIYGVLKKLDPHSIYLNAKEVKIMEGDLEGSLEGIGIEFFMLDKAAYVLTPVSNGPSERAGVLAGDRILKADGHDLVQDKENLSDIIKRLRGPIGSKVQLSVLREGIPTLLTIQVERDRIPCVSVDAGYSITPKIGYIKISRFTSETYTEFLTTANSLLNQGIQHFIVDLRDNTGGYLSTAVQIANSMLKPYCMIVCTQGRKKKYNATYRSCGPDILNGGHITILINEQSASASEILAGALQDNDRAKIVGRRSFGKGLVQLPIKLSDNSQCRLTIAHYYTPSGRCVQKPYKNGTEAYYQDFIKRYERGEYQDAKNIQWDENLKYKTVSGRTVYGGGGIMPDYFIPLNVSRYTEYLAQLRLHHIPQQVAIHYANQNRDQLKSMDSMYFIRKFETPDTLFKKVKLLAKSVEIKYNGKEAKASNAYLRNLIKAYIGKTIWGQSVFYQIYNQQDDELQTTIQVTKKSISS